nr:hypothetical protein CFP56_40259 [Quercus suber]
MGPTPKERKALNSPLPLTPTGLAATMSFFQSFSSSCSQLKARVILASSFQEPVSRERAPGETIIRSINIKEFANLIYYTSPHIFIHASNGGVELLVQQERSRSGHV